MTEPYTMNRTLSLSFEPVGTTSLDRNYQEVINLSFVLPRLHLNILKTEEILLLWGKKFSSFQRKRLNVEAKCLELSCFSD